MAEKTVDYTVSEQELLRLIGRLEPLHLLLSSSRWPVRVFGSIVEIAAGPVPDAQQNGALGNAVAAQAVGDQAPRFVAQAVQQPFEETLRCRAIPPLLHQDVQHHSVLVLPLRRVVGDYIPHHILEQPSSIGGDIRAITGVPHCLEAVSAGKKQNHL